MEGTGVQDFYFCLGRSLTCSMCYLSPHWHLPSFCEINITQDRRNCATTSDLKISITDCNEAFFFSHDTYAKVVSKRALLPRVTQGCRMKPSPSGTCYHVVALRDTGREEGHMSSLLTFHWPKQDTWPE